MLKKRYQLAIVLLLSCFSLIWQTEGLVELFVCEHYERAVCEGTPAYFTFSDQKGAETLIKSDGARVSSTQGLSKRRWLLIPVSRQALSTPA